MSNNDKKAAKVIIILGYLVEEGHFGIYKHEVIHYLNKLTNLYYPGEGKVGVNEYAELKKSIEDSSVQLCKLGKSTITMLMNSIMAVADDFARHCNGQRKKAWEQFIAYAQDNEMLSSARNPEIALEMMDKGAQVAEIIYN